MRDKIIWKSTQKVIPKRGIQITVYTVYRILYHLGLVLQDVVHNHEDLLEPVHGNFKKFSKRMLVGFVVLPKHLLTIGGKQSEDHGLGVCPYTCKRYAFCIWCNLKLIKN